LGIVDNLFSIQYNANNLTNNIRWKSPVAVCHC